MLPASTRAARSAIGVLRNSNLARSRRSVTATPASKPIAEDEREDFEAVEAALMRLRS